MSENTEPFSIVQATEADVPLALRFRSKLFEEMGVPVDTLLTDVNERLLSIYTDAYRSGDIVHFIAYDREGHPVAITGALIKRDFPYLLFKPGSYGWIIDVYTEPSYRGRKIATALLAATHDWLRQKGIQEAKLISAGAGARRLYERLGYRPTWEMSLNLSKKPTYNEIIDARSEKNS